MTLALLGSSAAVFKLQGLGLAPLVALPLIAATMDAILQYFRFSFVRVPDAAITTGLLLALLLPPTVPLAQAGAVTVAAVTLRHALRSKERPLYNPAALGVLVGALVFGMAPAWWGAIQATLVVSLGTLLTLRTPGSWRLPVGFLAAYAAVTLSEGFLFSGVTSARALLLGFLDPSILFFALFMVPEPRTSPSRRGARLAFGALVGVATAALPALVPSLAPLVALLLGNLVVTLPRLGHSAPRPATTGTERARRRERRRELLASGLRPDWTTGKGVTAGLLAFALLGATALASTGPSATPFGAFSTSFPTTGLSKGCALDNPSVASDILAFLHQRLGPSVILSANPARGTVVFYDPVNNATITETDVYEDFGYAEFNGDDRVVMGCAA